MRSDLARWIKDNFEPLNTPDLGRLDRAYYTASAQGVLMLFGLMQGLGSAVTWIFLKPLERLGLRKIRGGRGQTERKEAHHW